MSKPTSDQALRIRQLLDESERREARAAEAETKRLRYRPWLWSGVLGRWTWDWIERQSVVLGIGRTPARKDRPAAPFSGPPAPLTDAQRAERVRRALRGDPPSKPAD